MLLTLVHLMLAFPAGANHTHLAVVCLALLWFLDPERPQEGDLLLKALRWLLVFGLFYAGVQKLLYGYYFRGEALAYATANADNFAFFFQYIMPADEFERIRGLYPTRGAGPYRVASLGFVILSNLAYLGELILPLLLLVRRVRNLAIAGTIAYIIGIELAAREVFFGGFMINLALLFVPSDLNRRLLPVFAVMLFVVLAIALGILPYWEFH